MDRFLQVFKRTAVIALSAYAVLVILFLGSLIIDWAVGFRDVPFGFGRIIANFCMAMFWIQVIFAKLFLQPLPPYFLPDILKATEQNVVTVLVAGNIVNALLIVLASGFWAAIYSLAEAGDRKLGAKLDSK